METCFTAQSKQGTARLKAKSAAQVALQHLKRCFEP